MRNQRRRLSYEDIPFDASSSLFLRKVREPYFQFLWHQHPGIEIAYIIKGQGRRYVGDSQEDFVSGDLCLFGGNLPHTYHSKPVKGERHEACVVQFLPNALNGLLESAPEMRAISALLRRAGRGLHVIGKTRDRAEELVLRMHAQPTRSWRTVCDLVALLGMLAESDECIPLAMDSFEPVLDAQSNLKVNQVFDLLHGPLDGIPSQSVVSRALRMSPPAFSRFFKRCVGKTYGECVSELRIMAACRELIETDKNVIDIAYGAGFNNLSNFNRRFRDLKGMTPRGFRADYRPEQQ